MMITVCWWYVEVILALISGWWWCLDNYYWHMQWSDLTVSNWHRFRGRICYAYNNSLLSLCFSLEYFGTQWCLRNDASYYAADIGCLWWNLRWYLYFLSHIVFLIQMTLLMMDIYRFLFLMLLTDAYGVDHIWCMIVADNYHGIV